MASNEITNDEREERLRELVERARAHLGVLEDSGIDLEDLDCFLVGGAVRDALLGRTANDLDWVVVGETMDSMRERGFHDVESSSFPVLVDAVGHEWALTRTERKTDSGYKGFDVETDDVSLGEDLFRRDLTINAMALSLDRRVNLYPADVARQPDDSLDVMDGMDQFEVSDVNGEPAVLVDPEGGRFDLEHGQLDPVSEAFQEDPIRVLRLARYASRFGFDPTQRAIGLSTEVAYELNRCSRERIGMEIVKAMTQAESPRRFWEVLRDTGALAVIFPDLDRATIVPAGAEQYHAEGDCFEHTMMVLDRMHSICEAQDIEGVGRVRRLLMAVAHDLGKVRIGDRKGGLRSDDPPTRFGGHAEMGRSMIPHVAEQLGLEKQYEHVMQDACEFHMTFFDIDDVFDPDEERFDVGWAIAMVENFEIEHDPSESTVYGATPSEMVDLCHADHEGRLEPDVEIREVAGEYIWTEPVDGSVETTSPTFDREPYDRVIDAVVESIGAVDGYTAMREGLCEEHLDCLDDDEALFAEDDIAPTLEDCPDCRRPGQWIGERIEVERRRIVEDAILGGEDE